MYTAKDYSKLIGMEGLSDTLLKNHFTLYQGYVTNTNKIIGWAGSLMALDFTSIILRIWAGKPLSTKMGNCPKKWLKILEAMKHGKRHSEQSDQ